MVLAQVPGWTRAERAGKEFGDSRLAPFAIWTVAALSWAVVLVKARFGGGDFPEIWRGIHNFDTGHPIYFQNGITMSFLYPPSAAMVMAPLGLVSESKAALAFAVAQAIAISLACVLLLRTAGRDGRLLIPLAVLAASLLLPARNSLWLGNLDGIILGLEAVGLVAAVRGSWSAAALAIGLSLALKPVLLPLLVIFILAGKWRALAVAIAVPAGLSLVALSLTADGMAFVYRVVPFLAAGQSSQLENVNVSLSGGILSAHLPGAVLLAARGIVGLLVVVLVWLRWSAKELAGEPAVRLGEVSGLVMLGVLLTFSYAWAHYILFLIPLFALYGIRHSVVRGVLTAVAAYLLLFPDNDLWAKWSFAASQIRLTAGLLLLLASIAAYALSRLRRSQAAPASTAATAA